MKTEALCPTCNRPFSFWRLAFAWTPDALYCRGCRHRIVIVNGRRYMWAALAVFAVVNIVLFQFIIARDMWRLLILAVLWVVSFYTLESICGLIIVNVAGLSKPDEATPDR